MSPSAVSGRKEPQINPEQVRDQIFNPDRFGVFEKFLHLPLLTGDSITYEPAINKNWMLAGTNATTATFSTLGLVLATAGASADQVVVEPHTLSGQSLVNTMVLNSSKAPFFETKFRIYSDITACIAWAGLKLTPTDPTGATDADQIFVRYEAGVSSGKWVLWVSRDGADSTIVSTVTVAADTDYTVSIELDADRKPHVTINAESVFGDTMAIPLVAAKALVPCVGIQASEIAAKTIKLKHVAIARDW